MQKLATVTDEQLYQLVNEASALTDALSSYEVKRRYTRQQMIGAFARAYLRRTRRRRELYRRQDIQ